MKKHEKMFSAWIKLFQFINFALDKTYSRSQSNFKMKSDSLIDFDWVKTVKSFMNLKCFKLSTKVHLNMNMQLLISLKANFVVRK